MGSITGGFDGAAPSRSVKRPRPVKSCVECRRKRKLKCDRSGPCSQCQKSRRVCRYADQENGVSSDTSDIDPAERPTKRPQCAVGDTDVHGLSTQTDGIKNTPAVPLGADEISSRLERLERMVIERNPSTSPPLRLHSRRPIKGKLASRAPGVSGMQALLVPVRCRLQPSQFDEARDLLEMMSQNGPFLELWVDLRNEYSTLENEHKKALEPMSVYVGSMIPVQTRMTDILPPRRLCDRLLDAYFAMSNDLYWIIHAPSFQYEYARYWDGKDCKDNFLPQLLCILSIAARFGTSSRGLVHGRSTTIHVPTACVLVRDWLDGLRRDQVVDLAAFQTELLLLQALRTMAHQHHALWAQLGYVVRMAMTMKLQRDPREIAGLTESNREFRRRLWFTVLEMDLHVSLACNQPCLVRHGEYSCQPPRNLDDVDIHDGARDLPKSKPLDQATTNQLQAYTARTLPVRMEAAALIANRLETLQDYSEPLETGARLEKLLDDIDVLFPRDVFSPGDGHHPAGNHAGLRRRALLDMHVHHALIALYRPFALGSCNCPPHISATHLKSCMAMLRCIDETDPPIMASDKNDNDAAVVDSMAAGMNPHFVLLKNDMIDVAFSLCRYIKIAAAQQQRQKGDGDDDEQQQQQHWPLPGRGGHKDNHNEDEEDEDDTTPPPPLPQRCCCCPPYRPSVTAMVQAVERLLDRLVDLLRLEWGGHQREVVALSLVLEAVRPYDEDDGMEAGDRGVRAEARLRRILWVCLQTLQALPNVSCFFLSFWGGVDLVGC
ncbi:hypothetical protein C8A00DRAFT_19240 [Chaetomidium leptoderma]|uniref:Zn(2)-C6 fungal-type domain-containing protein n=1 Tax=Chaetomidium leptoderma TaxID=669021 RepID=A0AAN6ZT26_9PEZI|nr:hypothetical protein C8A00DRAFT_19240 [Chaetomidium leptoderma]